jgi:cytochrome c-type biogenesis protein
LATGLNPLLGFAAGALTILSPCVLPLVPIVLGTSAQRHRYGPIALAAGLVVSFTLVGFAVATLGARSGFDGDIVREGGAALLILLGATLLLPQLQVAAERLAAPLAGWAGRKQSGLAEHGLAGQALIGALLGLVWSPCVGPTLGAATVLAAEGSNLVDVALVMAAFGTGIAFVLVVVAFAARSVIARFRHRLMRAGGSGRRVLGGLLIAVGLMILTGGDRLLEGLVVVNSPQWLTDATTSI